MTFHAIRIDLGSRDENRLLASALPHNFEYIKEHDAYFLRGVYAEARRRYEDEMRALMMSS